MISKTSSISYGKDAIGVPDVASYLFYEECIFQLNTRVNKNVYTFVAVSSSVAWWAGTFVAFRQGRTHCSILTGIGLAVINDCNEMWDLSYLKKYV